MADDLSPSHPHTSTLDSDADADISCFLHTLLNASCSQPINQPPSHEFSGSAGFSDSPALVHPNLPFSYSSAHFPTDQEEGRVKSGTARTSSKRSRAAEVHNMSEKRRRQRINEKMKALQKLIPNSNKTDKASMLDEAIEYLKQLQLQVQMLTMRNCSSSSHPYYIPGAMQSASSLTLNEGNVCKIGSFTADQEAPVETLFNLSSQLPSDLMARMSQDNGSSGQAYIPEPSMARHNSSFNASISAKVPCKDVALPPLQLDMSHCGQSSSSGVSS